MRLFHRSDTDSSPIYLRPEAIDAVMPYPGEACYVILRGAVEAIGLSESAEEVLEACGYNAAPAARKTGFVPREFPKALRSADITIGPRSLLTGPQIEELAAYVRHILSEKPADYESEIKGGRA